MGFISSRLWHSRGMKQTRTAKLIALGIADTPGSFVTRVLDEAALTLEGLPGDRHAGFTMKAGVRQKRHPGGAEIRNARQLSIVSVEELREIGADVDWRKMGANLVLEGVEGLTKLAPSSRLLFPSGAALAIDSENLPCTKAGREVGMGDFVKAAQGRRGLVGWVERAGIIRVGDDVAIWTEAS
jgi:MOSC domain-containing protein YiiM